MQVEGYRKASRFTQKRDIKNLRKTTKGSEYRAQKSQIVSKARVERGKRLVNNNQTYAKVAVKTIGKTAAVGIGAAAVGVAGLPTGIGAVGLAGGALLTGRNIRQANQRIGEIRAYKKSTKK